MFKKLKNNKGFTLVEVIVVAVIVAVLALVAIQLYQGYVKESRRNTAENLAASAAGYLQSIVNAVDAATADGLASPLNGGASWVVDIDPGVGVNNVTFTCPVNATLIIAPPSVSATVGLVPSAAYTYR